MTIKYVTFKTSEELNKAIDKVVTDAKSLQSRIQVVAWGILCHAVKHGDYTGAQRLVSELPEGIRRKMLVKWFVKAGMEVSEKDAMFVGFNPEFCRDNADAIKARMWWEGKPERIFEGFDINAEIDRLIKKAQKAMKQDGELPAEAKADDKYKGVNVTPEHIKMLTAMKTNVQTVTTTH
ncbi:hypothetical protein BN110_015 [Yersinia phage phiR8-01]|uniref:Uncharacterized protein n=1 Tax=Yersinia phage phiR8-01 TaxID=1206556 RepID=I7KQN8_9CAUD|nr:hypothetical protein HOT05_gp04 [Yersinia phage phiR8-01]CCI88385.2 hypothetical protein BN110_015 [Yersinia phage phiR8-01]